MRDELSWFEKLERFFQREPESREDLIDLLHGLTAKQILDAEALAMIEGVLQVADMKVVQIMVPRPKISAIQENETCQEVIQKVHETGHSRYPVFDKDREMVKGILFAKDLLQYAGQAIPEEIDWDEFLRPALVVPETKRLDSLLQEFRRTHQHMAIAVDEYGMMTGLVTIEDILEQIVGEIDDEFDVDEEHHYVKIQPDGTAVVKAVMPLELFNEQFHTHYLTDQASTIGGYLLNQWHRIPRKGEVLKAGDLVFTVLRADHRRLHLISVISKEVQLTLS